MTRLLTVEDLRIAVADQDTVVRGDRLPPATDDGYVLEPGWVEVIPGASFGVDPGEVLAIIGESASGKTLTLLGAFGLLPSGAVAIGGLTRYAGHTYSPAGTPQPGGERDTRRSRRSRRRRSEVAGSFLADERDDRWRRIMGTEIGFLFQDPIASWTPVYVIGDQAGEALEAHTDLTHEEITERVFDALGEVQLPRSSRFFAAFRNEISRGQGQRAMLAAALLKAPRLLIADEPLSGLDAPVAAAILDLISDLCSKRNMAMVIVTHDLAAVARIADRVAVMYGGRIVEEGPVRDIFATPKHPYTAGLLGSMPAFARGRLVPIPGEAPRLVDVVPGRCAFADRCRYAVEVCNRLEPVLEPIAQSVAACHRKAELHLEGAVR